VGTLGQKPRASTAYAELTPAGFPVGLELDGPVGSDRALLALGLAIEEELGVLPAPTP
jgi:Asp-tRNA(Asn)/Glu-tRNA(Gln) amidotransferase A subunit family amidase